MRYQGGANAGHTVLVGEDEYVLHLIPSGILQEGKICVIGNGVVLNPKALIDEIDQLSASGLDRMDCVKISERAHIVLPYHQALDAARESATSGGKIGTTLRGIGPCYGDKAARVGIRMADFIDPERFKALLERNVEQKNRELASFGEAESLDAQAIFDEYSAYATKLAPCVCDITELLHAEDAKGSEILFEGAQGAFLDIDLGTYPFVTSSSTTFLGLGPGSGFSPRKVDHVYGITKAYATRVGEGPFPTELDGAKGDELRDLGGEFGATTGRPRRCGWLDIPALRWSIQICDVDALVITKLDVLDGLDEIQVATSYGDTTSSGAASYPALADAPIEPVYQTFKGWKAPTTSCRTFDELPVEAQEYLQFIADASGCPIATVSVGKERSQVVRLDPWLAPKGS